jgi:nitrogen regulatory protein P-II 1
MKKLEIITKPEKLEDVKDVVNKLGIYGMTVSMVSGCGLQKGRKEFYRGTEVTINLLPKIKIEIVCLDEKVEQIIESITRVVRTGKIGDGKIFIYSIDDIVRIRTGERGENAI